MFTFRHECPYCLNLADFTVVQAGEYLIKPENEFIGGRTISPDTPIKAYAVASCPLCKRAVLFVFETLFKWFDKMRASIQDFSLRYTGPQPKIIETHPSPPEPYSHPSIPEKARSLFIDLQRLIRDVRYEERASLVVSGCRSVIEHAVELLGAEGKTLYEKIENLLQKGMITRILADWAHQIRLEGNKAVHKINATQAEAEEMVEFLKIFLQYTFELPYRIEQKRRK